MSSLHNWVQCWGMAHAALSLTYFPEEDRTFRLVVNTAISGKEIRVRLSNKYGKDTVTIGAITAARCDKNGNIAQGESIAAVTYCGDKAFCIYPGQRITSDSVPLNISGGQYLCISVYVSKGALSSGNAINDASLMFCKGNMTQARTFIHTDRTRSKVIETITGVLGICQPLPIPLFEDIELDNEENAKAIVCFGDSLTQQGFWTKAFDNKIREAYPGKFSVINKSIGGNRLMRDSKFFLKGYFGVNAFARLEENVFSYDNINHAIICIGINDMLQPGSIAAPSWDTAAPHEYFEALTDLLLRFREKGIKTAVMNYPAFGGSIDARESKHRIRRIVNEWLEQNKDLYDSFVDIYSITAREDNPDMITRELLGKDNLHPNAHGGELIADAIPLEFFNEELKNEQLITS